MIRINLIALLAVLGIASAFIACTQNFCSLAKCENITECECLLAGKDFRPNSTMCGCCSQCIDYLEDYVTCGLECKTNSYLYTGGPPCLERNCLPSSSCVDNICVPTSSSDIDSTV